VRDALACARPEVIFHLAAQPLVGRSLRDPVATFEVNLMGTVNVLDAVRSAGEGVRVVVIVTSDRCYESTAVASRRLREGDPLGGSDPYAGSKAAAELAAGSYRRSFFAGEDDPRIATARAGNVIGGGDWGEDRLLPDAVRAVESARPLRVRSPLAARPWQHVLNPLSGYLRLAEALYGEQAIAGAWNFGPAAGDLQTVSWIVERLARLWDGELEWELEEQSEVPQDAPLALDSTAAERELGWRPASDLADALGLLVRWHRAQRRGEDMRRVSLEQLESFAVPAR
jgi:CDP-glucose 4,6-dehydratase